MTQKLQQIKLFLLSKVSEKGRKTEAFRKKLPLDGTL